MADRFSGLVPVLEQPVTEMVSYITFTAAIDLEDDPPRCFWAAGSKGNLVITPMDNDAAISIPLSTTLTLYPIRIKAIAANTSDNVATLVLAGW